MTKLHHVIVQINPAKGDNPGQVTEGVYTFEDGVVTLTDARGVPVQDADGKGYNKKVESDHDARQIAGRLTKQFRSARRGDKKHSNKFSGPISYPKLGIA